MSDNVLMPDPDVLIANECGFVRYRPAFTSIRIDETQDYGRRLIVNEDGHSVIFDLSADQAKALASLLLPSSPSNVSEGASS